MAADQPNRQFWDYLDNSGDHWCKMGMVDAAANAIDGSAAFDPANPVFPRETSRVRTRKAVFMDPTTFRKKIIVVYTPTAFAAITGATTLAVHVPGETAT